MMATSVLTITLPPGLTKVLTNRHVEALRLAIATARYVKLVTSVLSETYRQISSRASGTYSCGRRLDVSPFPSAAERSALHGRKVESNLIWRTAGLRERLNAIGPHVWPPAHTAVQILSLMFLLQIFLKRRLSGRRHVGGCELVNCPGL